MIRATIQLCTYNRAALLERALEACFDQTVADDAYEVVLVDDGSTDATPATIERMRERAGCRFTVVSQPNSGLAKGRNAGIARASGERIIFIDDDVLVLPTFVAEHLRSHAAHPDAIVRGGAIEVDDLDDLPPPAWSLRNYSGNYFWTTNVSVPLTTIRSVGGFDESFSEYGWEDIELGLRLRRRGVRAIFSPRALVYHYKPRPRSGNVAGMVAQARAQARTAAHLAALHPQWRTYLATGINPLQRAWHRAAHRVGFTGRFTRIVGDCSQDRELSDRELRAARALAAHAYFDELERALSVRGAHRVP